MLKQISCEIFNSANESIYFHNGLNVVIGDEKASNSIGKSTFLMIIDFVFGGKSYVDKNADVVKNISEHEFKYCFEFNNELFFFKRSTENYNKVFYCDNNYAPIKEFELGEYTDFLKQNYRIKLDNISFRNIVSRFSRIWQKSNYDVKKPLHEVSTQNNKEVIKDLIKIFDKYDSIKIMEDEIKQLSESKIAVQKAELFNYIPKVTKSDYKENLRQMNELKKDLEKAALSISIDIGDIAYKFNNDLTNEINMLKRQRLILENKLERIQKNLKNQQTINRNQFGRLQEFFPNVNIEKLNEIEEFHISITNVLNDELVKSGKEISSNIERINKQIVERENQLANSVSKSVSVSNTILQPMLGIAAEIYQRENENQIFSKKEQITSDLKITKDELSLIKGSIVTQIANLINSKMLEINKEIHKDGRRAPEIILTEDQYILRIEDNTGTGEAFTNLITFDLAILRLTQLPFLIHDSMLFKNIENDSLANIVTLYNQFDRQVFISIDEIGKYDEGCQTLLEKNKVLNLTNEKLLFNKDWRKK